MSLGFAGGYHELKFDKLRLFADQRNIAFQGKDL